VAAGDIVPVPGAQFEETLASASPDLLRAMIREFAQRMMDADVEVACNAGYGEVTPDRVNSRNGYRRREWDTRAGTIELAIPKLRQGSYFPGFLEHRRRAERALASVVATSYLLGVSTRRVEKLAASLGVTGLSKSQVSVMAAELDELVEGFRNRPLDRGPYTFVWIDALTQKVREGGRTVNMHCLIATGVNADGYREILGIRGCSATGPGNAGFPPRRRACPAPCRPGRWPSASLLARRRRSWLPRARRGLQLPSAGRQGPLDRLAPGDDVLLGGAPVLVLLMEVAQVLRRVAGRDPLGVVQPEADLGADLGVADGLHGRSAQKPAISRPSMSTAA